MRILVFDDAECVRVRVRVCVCGDAFSRMKKMIDELFFVFRLWMVALVAVIYSLSGLFSLSLSLSLSLLSSSSVAGTNFFARGAKSWQAKR